MFMVGLIQFFLLEESKYLGWIMVITDIQIVIRERKLEKVYENMVTYIKDTYKVGGIFQDMVMFYG